VRAKPPSQSGRSFTDTALLKVWPDELPGYLPFWEVEDKDYGARVDAA